MLSFFQPIFSQVQLIFLKLQSVRSTASSVNNSFREFREYIEDIKVTDIPFEIQETATEVISKILFDLENNYLSTISISLSLTNLSISELHLSIFVLSTDLTTIDTPNFPALKKG